ncbi:hypothetical protein [Vibrio tarriae]|uniref:hypothetical protein n=1 Tax=Vibrio tarriae TaxID=2014742 RepID=UPI000DE32D04|nr:hypothetical protein [Vibrio tarriae]RBM38734.1 hypothetical protein DLR63_09910 [Vibrio tarriae]
MEKLSITECQRDLAALDAADQLTQSITVEIDRFKTMDMKDVIAKATKALFGGYLSPESLGLPSNFFTQLEQLAKLNNVARSKYRAHVMANLEQLNKVETVECAGGSNE